MTSHLASLPPDALVNVLSRVHDLHAVASTCRLLRDMCGEATLRLWFVRGVDCARALHDYAQQDQVAATYGMPPPPGAPLKEQRDHPLVRELRATPPLLAALRWRATRKLFASDPQALAEHCFALIDALTPTTGERDAAARRLRPQEQPPPSTTSSPHHHHRPLPCPRDGRRGPPVPTCVARMGCDAPHAQPFLHAAAAHCRAGRPLHALVALASALPPVLQPLLLPALVAGGHAEAALRLLDGEGCLDQPGCLGGRFDLDLGGGGGPGALLPADAPLLPRLRACVKQAGADGVGIRGLIAGEEDWWWWWLPPGTGMQWPAAPVPEDLSPTGARRAPEEEARLLKELEASGLRCLRWAVWEPVRLGDRPPPGLGPCAGGGARRAFVAPLAMALAAAVKLIASSASSPSASFSFAGGGGGRVEGDQQQQPVASAEARLLWALTEACLFGRLFRHHLPGRWWRRSPLLLPPRQGRAGEVGSREDEPAAEEENRTHDVDDTDGAGSDDDDNDDDDSDEEPSDASDLPPIPNRLMAFGQRRQPESPASRRKRWLWRGRAAFAPNDGGGDGGGGGAGGEQQTQPQKQHPPPWCGVVSRLSESSHANVWSRELPSSAAAADDPLIKSRLKFSQHLRAAMMARLRLRDSFAAPGGHPASYLQHTGSPDPVGSALFGPQDDPLALPALLEMAAVAGGASRLRAAWVAAGGARGLALFWRSARQSTHLLAALACGGAGEGAEWARLKGEQSPAPPPPTQRQQQQKAEASSSPVNHHPHNEHDSELLHMALVPVGHSGGHWFGGFVRRGSSAAGPHIGEALCAAGERGNAAATRAILACAAAQQFGVLASALSRACGGASFRLPVPPPRGEAWHPAGATLSPALRPPSSREWPLCTLSLLLAELTGPRLREEAADALCPSLQLCLLRRPADRERTFAAVWDALRRVPISAEQLSSRTGQKRAPTSGRGAGGVEGFGEPTSILALLAKRGDLERLRWAIGAAPTAAFRAREYPILLAMERGYSDVVRLLEDAPRVADGLGGGIQSGAGPLRGGKQAAARGRAFTAARDGDVPALMAALEAVEIDPARNGWWSPLLAEIVSSCAAAAVREWRRLEMTTQAGGLPALDLWEQQQQAPPRSTPMRTPHSSGFSSTGPHAIMLMVLLRDLRGKMAPEDAYAATLGVALARDFGGRPWGRARPASGAAAAATADESQEEEEEEEDSKQDLLPPFMCNYVCFALDKLCDAAPARSPTHGTAFGPLRPLLVAALLADGSPCALAAVARIEDEGVSPPALQQIIPTRQRPYAPGGPPAWSLGLDVGLILARACQLPWPVASVSGHRVVNLPSGERLTLAALAACAEPAEGWPVPTERPFNAQSVLSAACGSPQSAVQLALSEARAAARQELELLEERRQQLHAASRLRAGGGRVVELEEQAENDEEEGNGEDEEERRQQQQHHPHRSFADVAEEAGAWYAEEESDRSHGVDLEESPIIAVGARHYARLDLARAGVLAPRRPTAAQDAAALRQPWPGDARPREEPRAMIEQTSYTRPGAVHARSRPYPFRPLCHVTSLAPAAAAAVQARGVSEGSLGLTCAHLLSHRGSRAIVDAAATWRTWGTDGGDGGADGQRALHGPLLRPPPSAGPGPSGVVAPLADVREHSVRFALRGADLAAEL